MGKMVTRFGIAPRAYTVRFVRKHNRQTHKCTILKGGIRKRNNTDKYVHGFQLFDMVKCQGKVGFVFGRRQKGAFDIRDINGVKITEITPKKLELIKQTTTILIGCSAPGF